MPTAVPPRPGLVRYTSWEVVPDGLLTKTQLAARGLKPGSEPEGQVLYHGNCYAPLYAESAAVPKRGCSPAQRAVLDRARQLQYECRRCGRRTTRPLPKGRRCGPCSNAVELWQQHDQAQALARELVADEDAVLLVVDAEPGVLPAERNVAVVGVRDSRVLYAAAAGEYGTAERGLVLDRLDELLDGRRIVEEGDHSCPPSRRSHRLVSLPGEVLPPGPHPLHPWALVGPKVSVAGIWSAWFGWTDHPSSTIPSVPRGEQFPVPWSRSPDTAVDGQSMARLLHRIAEGAEPVWERAAWRADGHGVPQPA